MKNSEYSKLSNLFLFFFVVISFIEIIAELFNDTTIVWVSKPLIIPFLLIFYFFKSKIRSNYFIASLVFSSVSNILFIENTFFYNLFGFFFALFFMIIIIYLVLNQLNKPPLNSMIFGAIPFVITYAAILIISYESIHSNLLFFIFNAFFVIFLGGFGLGNYAIYKSKTNYFLFISALLFALMHFVYLFKLFSVEEPTMHALSMLFYVLGQLMLTRFILFTEKKMRNFKIVNI